MKKLIGYLYHSVGASGRTPWLKELNPPISNISNLYGILSSYGKGARPEAPTEVNKIQIIIQNEMLRSTHDAKNMKTIKEHQENSNFKNLTFSII